MTDNLLERQPFENLKKYCNVGSPTENQEHSIDEPGIVIFRMLQSDAFVSKCNSFNLIFKLKI